jgi:predicted PurR-regulated permease PerM
MGRIGLPSHNRDPGLKGDTLAMDDPRQRSKAGQILLTVAAFIIVVAGMRAAASILVPFLLAGFIAIISAPPMFWLRSKGLPVWLALLLVIFGVCVMGTLVAALVGSSVKDFSTDLPGYDAKLRQMVVSVTAWLQNLGIDTSELALQEIFNPGAAMKLVAALLNNLSKVLTNGFLILMTVIFMLLEALGLPAKLNFILGHDSPSHDSFEQFVSNVKDYMAIKTVVSLITGILVAVWLMILGVSYPVLWGLLAFVLNFVPNIGSIIAAVPAVLLALLQVGLFKTLLVALGYGAVNIIMGSVIEPRFMGRGLGLSTLAVFLSLLFWGWVLGPVGMLLSVPLTITAKIALDSREETRWLAVLIGPDKVIPEPIAQTADAGGQPAPSDLDPGL